MKDKIKNTKKGFTLAELLIVVAIIAVLVAISIPIFTSQLKKARLAVDHAAIRDAYALIQVANNTETVEIDGHTWTYSELREKIIDSGVQNDPDKHGNTSFVLADDCNSLLEIKGVIPPENAYRLKENGTDWENSTGCDICKTIGSNISTSGLSFVHFKDRAIYAFYSRTNNKIYLGQE